MGADAVERKSVQYGMSDSIMVRYELNDGEEDERPSGGLICTRRSNISFLRPSPNTASCDSRKVMFFSNGTIAFRGPRRSKLMKERQTGNMMKATSTCRTKAAERAI